MIGIEQAKAAVAVVLVGGCLYAGWHVRGWYEGAKDAAVLEAERKTRQAMTELANQVATNTENAIRGIRIENRTIYNDTQREIVEKPIYRDCVLPDDGRMLVNKARGGAAAGQPDGAVRTDAPAR